LADDAQVTSSTGQTGDVQAHVDVATGRLGGSVAQALRVTEQALGFQALEQGGRQCGLLISPTVKPSSAHSINMASYCG
jgi:hypothetical protein